MTPRQLWRRRHIKRALLSDAKYRAKTKGLPFDLTEEDIDIPSVCPILGIPLKVGSGDGAPSLDRVDPSGGYTKGNVEVISWRANRVKSGATADELTRIALYFLSRSEAT